MVACLLGEAEAHNPEKREAQGQRLIQMCAKGVLMKGGHAHGGICTDVLVDASGVIARFDAPRIETGNTHGTGCTYSAAIAAQLAQGRDLIDAVENAHA